MHTGEMNLRSSQSGLTWSLLVLAFSTNPVLANAETPQQCASVSDDRARLACYDGIFRDAAARATAAGSVAPAAATGAAAASAAGTSSVAASPQDDFGLTDAAKRARDPEQAKVQMPESVTDKVASVGHRPTGELVVTLANGQVWVQIESGSRARVGAGQTVTIKKASLGSYLLVPPSGVATRVRRVK